jgi:hypothetical protein
MSTETNGFVFAFPEVKKAYKTSIRRRLTSKVIGIILSRSLPIAIVAGIGVYLLHVAVGHLLSNAIRMGSWLGYLGLIIYPVIVAFGGILIGLFVGNSAIKAKFPDTDTVGKLALGIGFAGYLAYLTMYIIFFNAPERFDHWIDYLRQAFYLILFVGTAWEASVSSVKETPFCENCNEFMISDVMGEYNKIGGGKGLEITQESAIIDILNSRQFSKFNELNKNSAKVNYCTIRIWHCPICAKNGFVDCITFQSRSSFNSRGELKTDSASRLIHSSHIDGKELQVLMQAKQLFGIPSDKGVL